MATDDDSDIPESGAVFTFGKSKFADNLPNKFWVRNDEVHSISCGDEHTVLVAESGRIFSFGTNDWGQLGLGHSKVSTRPTCIKSLKHEKITHVACGNTHTIVATESKRIYSFGNNNENQLGISGSNAEEPKWVESIESDSPFKMLMAGADHSVALTDDGRVFVWGGGGEGQLGLGEDTENASPTELPLDGKAVCIGCGYYHTAVVTDDGNLYVFGENDTGKLGLGPSSDINVYTPQKVPISEKVKWVSCGGTHTVAITVKGHVYTFGEGNNGQLGHGTETLSAVSPLLLKLNFKVSSASCGENHTAVISEKGQLYTFGDGRHGKLGLGQESVSNEFKPCKCTRFNNFFVEKVSCGGCHMLVLAKPRLENGYSAASESEEEVQEDIIEDEDHKKLSHHLKPDDSIDLNNSVSARDRRRQLTINESLSRTLPPLGSTKGLPSLNATMPPIKLTKVANHKPDEVPNIKLNGSGKKSPEHSDYESEAESDVSDKAMTPKDQHNHQDQNNNENEIRPPPRPIPRQLPAVKKEEDEEVKDDTAEKINGKDDSYEAESEDEEEIENKKPKPMARKVERMKEQNHVDSDEDYSEDEKDEENEKSKIDANRQDAEEEKEEHMEKNEIKEEIEEKKKPRKKLKKKTKKKESDEDEITGVKEKDKLKKEDEPDEDFEDDKKSKKKGKKKKKKETESTEDDVDAKKTKKGKKKKGKQADEAKEEEEEAKESKKDEVVEENGDVKNLSDGKDGVTDEEKPEDRSNQPKKKSRFCTIL